MTLPDCSLNTPARSSYNTSFFPEMGVRLGYRLISGVFHKLSNSTTA